MKDGRLIVADAVRTPRGVEGNAMLVTAGRVSAIGDRDELRSPGQTEERYLGGTVVPGLRDAHFHPVGYTAALAGISLKTATDFADVAARLRAGATSTAGHGPVIAIRLDDESLAERRLPTRTELDDAVPDRVMMVHRYCGHIAIVNSVALRAAGIDADTPDPDGGVIDRDVRGIPTGVLRETAIDLAAEALRTSAAVTPTQLTAAMSGLAGLGITSIGAMTRTGAGPWAGLGNEAEITADAAAEMPIRIHCYIITDQTDELRTLAGELSIPGTNVRWAGLKRFGDGSLGGHTAAMHRPFADRPGDTGTLRLTPLDEALARTSIELGGGVAVHAIGDRACSEVVGLFERLVASGADGSRLRIEHASVIAPGDIARLARLDAVASVQPAFMASEHGWLEKRVGAERLADTYPFASFEARGVTLAGGSDCPVEPPNPWHGMAAARDRAGIHPPEALSAQSAFRMFTSGGAAALGEPAPLSIGSPADFVVVDRDPVTATPDQLRSTEVIDTWVGGVTVPVDRSASTWVE